MIQHSKTGQSYFLDEPLDAQHGDRERPATKFSFREHGDYRIDVRGSVVHCFLDAGFNYEGIVSFCQSLTKAINRLTHWVMFIHTSESTMATPEAVEYSQSQISKLTTYGCGGIAFLTSNTITRYLASKLSELATMPFLASDSLETLAQFCCDRLFGINSDSTLVSL